MRPDIGSSPSRFAEATAAAVQQHTFREDCFLFWPFYVEWDGAPSNHLARGLSGKVTQCFVICSDNQIVIGKGPTRCWPDNKTLA